MAFSLHPLSFVLAARVASDFLLRKNRRMGKKRNRGKQRDNREHHSLHIDTNEGERQECAASDTEAPKKDPPAAEEEHGNNASEARKDDDPIRQPGVTSSRAQEFENILKFVEDEKQKIGALLSGDYKRKRIFEEVSADIQRRGKMFEEDVAIMKAKESEILENDFNIWTKPLEDLPLVQSESSSTVDDSMLQSGTSDSTPRLGNEQASGVNQAALISLEMKIRSSCEAENVNCDEQDQENVFEPNKESKRSEKPLTDEKLNADLEREEDHLKTLAENIPNDADISLSQAERPPLDRLASVCVVQLTNEQTIKNLTMEVESLHELNFVLDSGDFELFRELSAKPSHTNQINKILDLPESFLWLFKEQSLSQQALEIVKEDNLHLQQEIARKQAEISVTKLLIDDSGLSTSEQMIGYRADQAKLKHEIKLLYDRHCELFSKIRTAGDELTSERDMTDKLVQDSLDEYNVKLNTFRDQQGQWKKILEEMENRVSSINSFAEMKFGDMKNRLTACVKELQGERSNFKAFRSKWKKQVDRYCELMEESIALEIKDLILEEKENLLKMKVLEEENLEIKFGDYEKMVKEMMKMMNTS